jgi:serine/threonine protein kinase
MAAAMMPTDSATQVRPAPPPEVAQVAAAFPLLEVQTLIGAGGMGAVFCARQPKLNRLVALKVLPASLAERDPAFAERFEREGQMLARLHHPNIVAVYDSGRAGDFFYLLMEHVDGVNLRQAMRASRFTPEQALNLVPRICDALQYAHEEGVLHRDIKPENILLDSKGRVKLADFGIGKMIGEAEPGAVDLPSSGDALTQAGVALGTPQYMAPEQRDEPNAVDHRADIYSLGVVFYELLTGELPAGKFTPPSEISASDPRVDAIVRQALEKERERRQQSAGEVRTQVETIAGAPGLETSPPPAPAAPVRKPLGTTPLKMTRGRFTTPEFLNTFAGGTKRHEGTGDIRLFPDRISLSHGWQQQEIPLTAIHEVGFAILPWWLNPARHRYLSLIYEHDGQSRQLLFLPGLEWFAMSDSFDARVAEWIVAIREAAQAATGQEMLGNDSTPAVVQVRTVSALAALAPLILFIALASSTSLLGGGLRSSSSFPLVVSAVLLLIAASVIVLIFRVMRSPGTSTPAPPAALAAVESWLALMDRGDYAEAWSAAADSFHKAVRQEAWVELSEQVRRPLGVLQSRAVRTSRQTTSLPGMPRGPYLLARFDSNFAELPRAKEIVIFTLSAEGQWQAAGYLIRPRHTRGEPAPHWEAYANAS